MKLEEIFANAPTVIDQAQREHYYDQGYLVFPSLIETETLVPLRAAADRIVEKTRELTESSREIDLENDHTAENPRLRRAAYLDDLDFEFWGICADSVIPDIAADLLGPNVRFREIMLNFKWAGGGAEVKWHQDLVFYPHTHSGTMQFLLFLEDVAAEQGPLELYPGSHLGPIFEHYDERGEWTGAVRENDLASIGSDGPIAVTGPAGTVSVHHSRTIHGSRQNKSSQGRPVLVLTYSAADAIPYTAPAYPSSRYGVLVRGEEPGYAHHEELHVPMPPDWSDGYTSIFAHQEDQGHQEPQEKEA